MLIIKLDLLSNHFSNGLMACPAGCLLQQERRGVHTIGSLRVLNDVFTSTGTPVRSRNAAIKSY